MGSVMQKLRDAANIEWMWGPVMVQLSAIAFQKIDESRVNSDKKMEAPDGMSYFLGIFAVVYLAIVLITLALKYMGNPKEITSLATNKDVVHFTSLFSLYFDLLIIYLSMTEFRYNSSNDKFHGYVKILLYIAFLPTLFCVLSFLRTWITQPSKDNIRYVVCLTLANICFLAQAMNETPHKTWNEWRDLCNAMASYGLVVILFSLTVDDSSKEEVISMISYFILAFCALSQSHVHLCIFMLGWIILALIINWKSVFLGKDRMRLMHVFGAVCAISIHVPPEYYSYNGDFRKFLAYTLVYGGFVLGVIGFILYILAIFGVLKMEPTVGGGSGGSTSGGPKV